MFKLSKIIFTSLALCIMITFTCSADSYTKINDLIERGKEFNKKTVIIKAEVVGEPLNRGKFTWVNVNDGTNAIGLWIKSDEVKKINKYGNYKYKGDIVEVKGVFSRDCNEHGGDVDIHVHIVKVLESGYNKEYPVSRQKVDMALVLMLATITLVAVYYKKIRV